MDNVTLKMVAEYLSTENFNTPARKVSMTELKELSSDDKADLKRYYAEIV